MPRRCTPPVCALAALLTALLAVPLAASADPVPQAPLAGAEEVAATVRTAPGRLPQLAYQLAGKQQVLPLEHTAVFAELTGFVARVDVVQTYHNPAEAPIEAIYTFPLPENAAVDDMRIRIGERIIRAEIRKRAEAKAEYEAAKANGHTAALLEQERPNIFTQSVANIAPGESIEVSISYVQPLTHDNGRYEWVFPMVVGPRFIPGNATGKHGPGWALDTDEVDDASRITPPILGAGTRSKHDIDVEVIVDPGLLIEDIGVPTHDVDATAHADGTMQLRLSPADRIPNRDFVLRYAVPGDGIEATHFAAPDADGPGGTVSLLVQPPARAEAPAPREVVFVVDVSGSMSGAPLAQAKAAMRRALRGLSPDDTFNVYTFSGGTARAFEAMHPGNADNIERALRFIENARAGGGTYLANAVDRALSPPVEAGRDRFVVFLTDGYVGNERAIFGGAEALVAAQKRNKRRARVFAMGIGSSVNRHLIDGLSTAGDGAALYVTLSETPDEAVDRFWRMVDTPILTDIHVDWGALAVDAVEPATLPDLLASRPLVVLARYGAPGRGVVTVRGKARGKDVAIPIEVELPARVADGAGRALPTLWARARVETLSRRLWRGHDAQAVEDITALGLRHRIVTEYTSFIAVDTSRVVGDGKPNTVVQPVEAPLGVDPKPAGAVLGGRIHIDSVPGTPPGFTGDGSVGYWPNAVVARVSGSGGGGIGVGGLGTIGTGGGYGRGASRFGVRPPAVPKVVPGTPMVRGALDKNIIRRVIRRHRNAQRACYEQALAKDPTLAGTVRIKFVIDPNGAVTTAEVVDDTLADDAVGKCVAENAKRWVFPAPKGGGVVVVTYPFRFDGGDRATENK